MQFFSTFQYNCYSLINSVKLWYIRYISVRLGTSRYVSVHSCTFRYNLVHLGTFRYISVHSVHLGIFRYVSVFLINRYISVQLCTLRCIGILRYASVHVGTLRYTLVHFLLLFPPVSYCCGVGVIRWLGGPRVISDVGKLQYCPYCGYTPLRHRGLPTTLPTRLPVGVA